MLSLLPHLHPRLQYILLEQRWRTVFAGTSIEDEWDSGTPFWGLADCYKRKALTKSLLRFCRNINMRDDQLSGLTDELNSNQYSPGKIISVVEAALLPYRDAVVMRNYQDPNPVSTGFELCIRSNSYNYMSFEVGSLTSHMSNFLYFNGPDVTPDRVYDLRTCQYIDTPTTGFSACCLYCPDLNTLRYLLDRIFQSRRTETYQNLRTMERMPNTNGYFDVSTRRFRVAGETVHTIYESARVCCSHVDDRIYVYYFGLLVKDPRYRLTLEERALVVRTDLDNQDELEATELVAVQESENITVSPIGAAKYSKETKIQIFRSQIWRNAYTVPATDTKEEFCPMNAKCYCCGTQTITAENFEAGHILASTRGGPLNYDNLRPICSSCNNQMKQIHMGAWIVTHSYKSLGSVDPLVVGGVTKDQMREASAAFNREMKRPHNPLAPQRR